MAIYINTNQNVNITYEISSIGSRILAFLIDGAVIIGLLLAFSFVFGVDNNYIWIILMVPIFFYHLISELAMNGQSIGKRTVKIKVMKQDGSSASFANYFLRFLLRPIDSFYFIGLVFVFFTKKGQRLGDLAAGTVMVRIQEEMTFSSLSESLNASEEEIRYPEVNHLKDKDIDVIKSVLSNWKENPKHENVVLLAAKIEQILNVENNDPPYMFLEQVVKDYHAMYA